jgi:hypothetical protein
MEAANGCVRLWKRGIRRRFVLPEAGRADMIASCGYGNYMSSARIPAAACCVLFSCLPELFATGLVLKKVPPLTVEQAPGYPQNLARYYLGATVEAAPQSIPVAELQLSSKWEDTNTAEAALLCNDPTVGYALPSGGTTLLVSFVKIETIDSVSFLNRGARGHVKIAISNAKLSADSPQWHDIAEEELTGNVIKAKMGPSEAKYVRLTFDITEPGRIAGFGIYCTATVSDFSMARARKVNLEEKPENFELIRYSFTDVHARARAIYVSSGEDPKQANNMIDDQPATSFTFAASDAAPTAIIDLGNVASLRRISVLYSPQHGSVDFYVLRSLPDLPGTQPSKNKGAGQGLPVTGNLPDTLRFDDSSVADLKLVGSVVDDGRGRAAIDFPEATGRYVMVKWNPAAQQETPFSIAEIAAFGGKQPTTLIAAEERTAGERNEFKEFKEMAAAKEMPKEGPAAPAEGPPPSLPGPPPFVFVPEIVPVSPE